MTVLIAFLTVAPTIYVAPSGNDLSPGTQRRPVKTIQRGIEIARKDSASVSLGKGTYALRTAIEITKADRNLRITGSGVARILGGRVVSSSEPVRDPAILGRLSLEARRHVRVVELEKLGLTGGTLRRRGFADGNAPSALELFSAGRPMTLARYPNDGSYLKVSSTDGKRSFGFESERPKTWKSTKDVWAFGYFHFDWCDTYDRVSNFDIKSKTAELANAPDYGIATKRRFYFFNILEELDLPGEYFVDRDQGKIYFWPPQDKGEIIASGIEAPLIHLSGAEGVTLEGLSIEGGRGGGILVEGSQRVRVQKSVVRNMGVFGISIRNSTDSGVSGCNLSGLGAKGIELSGGDRKTLTSGRLFAKDNVITGYSRWPRTYQPAIAIEGVGALVSHNWIEDAPHNAILMSGNDHRIEFNNIQNVCLETGDSGAIYMGHNLTMRGNQIRFNRFRNIVPTLTTEGNFTNVSSVYLDDQWSGTTIFGNLFEGKGTGVQLGGGRDNLIENNVFLGKDPALHIDQRGKDWAKDKESGFRKQAEELHVDQPPYSTRYPQLRTLLKTDVMLATGNGFIRNIVTGNRPFWWQDGLSEKDLVYKDNALLPKVTTLQSALQQAPKNFKTIPIKEIGPTTKRRPGFAK